MRDKELTELGLKRGGGIEHARRAVQRAVRGGLSKKQVRKILKEVARDPAAHVSDPHFAELARALQADQAAEAAVTHRKGRAPFRQWGENLDPKSIEQMNNACALPVSVRGALMPDAHVGYGLPIGGVLATHKAVIPYAVGVDIACRMKLTALDLPAATIDDAPDRLRKAIEQETKFGVGACFKDRRDHGVMDRDWTVSPITLRMKDRAWAQLGTSGSGNHFVEFGELEVLADGLAIPRGRYLALLTHSGSRGTGAEVCGYYSRIAMDKRRDLPRESRHLAWLDLDSHTGQEYWAAMELMGAYAAANHECIHRHIARNLGVAALLDIENHHNFAWKETHDGMDVVVHRKGATPADAGQLGIIPGSMATPAYIVRGRGSAASLNSASHGAGRVMSRTEAKKRFTWDEARRLLDARKVTLLSAGLDEVPMVYKDIDEVMAAQADLVEVLARFQPRIVKMAPAGERPED
ncbi:MAG TPA: RtcB family protein [Candidatus Hydrogenedentes bacterium]|nr:RtcB family protein [Candidatus Hydrogenedentota bacterium]